MLKKKFSLIRAFQYNYSSTEHFSRYYHSLSANISAILTSLSQRQHFSYTTFQLSRTMLLHYENSAIITPIHNNKKNFSHPNCHKDNISAIKLLFTLKYNIHVCIITLYFIINSTSQPSNDTL